MIQALGEQLKVKQQVIATAIVYFKRFYVRNSFKCIDPLLLAPTCVFLASKVEEFGVISNNRLITTCQQVGKFAFVSCTSSASLITLLFSENQVFLRLPTRISISYKSNPGVWILPDGNDGLLSPPTAISVSLIKVYSLLGLLPHSLSSLPAVGAVCARLEQQRQYSSNCMVFCFYGYQCLTLTFHTA